VTSNAASSRTSLEVEEDIGRDTRISGHLKKKRGKIKNVIELEACGTNEMQRESQVVLEAERTIDLIGL